MNRFLMVMALVVPAAAWAQDTGDDEKHEPIPDPNIPDNPIPRETQQEVHKTAPRYTKKDYPLELIKRPMTLARFQAQVSLEMPFVNDGGHPVLTQVLRGAFGVTRDVEVGLTYSFGLERLNAQTGENGYEAGKAVSIDGAVTILPNYLAAQVRLPMYLDGDNFGVGLTLGAPFRLPLADTVAIYGARDLIRIKLAKLAVDAADPAYNLSQIARLTAGGVSEAGFIDARAGVLWQAKPNLAAFGELGFTFPDFSTENQATELYVGALYSPKGFVDLGARTGFGSLAHAGDSFTLSVFVAVRL